MTVRSLGILDTQKARPSPRVDTRTADRLRLFIATATDRLHGSNRHITISVLRSLFGHCKKTGTIFRDPTVRIRPTQVQYSAILPLQPQDIPRPSTPRPPRPTASRSS